LKKRFTYGNLDCFLKVKDDILKRDNLADKATENIFALGDYSITIRRSLTLLLKVRLESLFFHLPSIILFMVMFLVTIINGHC